MSKFVCGFGLQIYMFHGSMCWVFYKLDMVRYIFKPGHRMKHVI